MQQLMALLHNSLKDVTLKSLNHEQRIKLKNNYNCKLYLFDYGLNAGGDLVIKTSKSNYTNLLYYMGFAAGQRDPVKVKVEVADDVVVVYDIQHQRVVGLAEKLGLVG